VKGTFAVERPFPDTHTDLMVDDRFSSGQWSVLQPCSELSANNRQNNIYNENINKLVIQDAQLSQRDRAAGCVIVFAKSRTLELRDNDLQTLQVYLQPL